MKIFLLIFLFLLYEGKFLAAENCLRFCVVRLSSEDYKFKNDLLGLNLQYCSHLILNADIERKLRILNLGGEKLMTYFLHKYADYNLLKKVVSYLQRSKNVLLDLKILTSIRSDDIKLNETENSNNTRFLKLYQILDGFYFDWQENFRIQSCLHVLESIEGKKCYRKGLNKILKEFRQKFKNKIIVTSVGAENAYLGYYDLKVLDENVDFFVMAPNMPSLAHIHTPNYSFHKEWYEKNVNKTLTNVTNTLMNNGISKSKLLVSVDGGPAQGEEPRLRIIWSSINNFPGILIDDIQDFHKPCGFYGVCSEPAKVHDDIAKFEILHTCPSTSSSDTVKIQNFTCYYSLTDKTEFHKISKEIYQKCDRIIFHVISTNYTNNIPSEKLHQIIEYFRAWNLTNTSLILSLEVNYGTAQKIWKGLETFEVFSDLIALNVQNIIERYNLDGIELVWDESAKNLQTIITKIRNMVSKDIEIGLQVNAFWASKLVDTMNNVTWVTHKINPLSDAALTIFYQWKHLNENYDLDLKKVLIKISPAIWQQADSSPGKHVEFENENPEHDTILNRKYLCLNETIKQNLPKNDTYLNLPIIFSVCEKDEIQEKMVKDDRNLLLAGAPFLEPQKSPPKEQYYLRYETKELFEYKVKIAERFGFGGIAFDSITDDDFEDICGASLFQDIIKIVEL